MSSTRDVAVRARSGDECGEELQASVRRLAERVRTHNDREEELLQDIIPVVDAWGPVRSAVMTVEHLKEHHRFHTALLSLPSTAAETAGVGVIALLALMGNHMEREGGGRLSRRGRADRRCRPVGRLIAGHVSPWGGA
jgi:hypothetical protein